MICRTPLTSCLILFCWFGTFCPNSLHMSLTWSWVQEGTSHEQKTSKETKSGSPAPFATCLLQDGAFRCGADASGEPLKFIGREDFPRPARWDRSCFQEPLFVLETVPSPVEKPTSIFFDPLPQQRGLFSFSFLQFFSFFPFFASIY